MIAAEPILTRYVPVFVLAPLSNGRWGVGEDVYLADRDEAAVVGVVHADGSAEALRAEDVAT